MYFLPCDLDLLLAWSFFSSGEIPSTVPEPWRLSISFPPAAINLNLSSPSLRSTWFAVTGMWVTPCFLNSSGRGSDEFKSWRSWASSILSSEDKERKVKDNHLVKPQVQSEKVQPRHHHHCQLDHRKLQVKDLDPNRWAYNVK